MKVQSEFRIECEECESMTIVLVEDKEPPEFCPMCGRRVEAEGVEYLDGENELKAILDY